jgi:predicted RNA-binding Zn-ribbon protein involved in translation (DUF1610 family)
LTVHFTCPKCGLGYKATQEQFPEKRAGHFDCIDCRSEVHSWSGIYDFTGWQPITMRSPRP